MIINRKREAQEKICLCCNSRKSQKEKHREAGEKRKRKSIEKLISYYERFKGITRDFIAREYKWTSKHKKSKFKRFLRLYGRIEKRAGNKWKFARHASQTEKEDAR